MERSRPYGLMLAFAAALLCQTVLWLYARDIRGRWTNVPPVPGREAAAGFTLGDGQLAYRIIGIMLQNLGDTGGRAEALDDYDYGALTRWFFLADSLDSRSHFIPFLAAFYYGAAQEPGNLGELIRYIRAPGARPGEQRWRWLAHAVYLARFQMKDMDLALELARQLAALPEAEMPAWTRQMPAFVLNARGNREEALAVMLEILKSSAGKIHPNEVNFTRDYICTRLLEKQEAQIHPLCQDIP